MSVALAGQAGSARTADPTVAGPLTSRRETRRQQQTQHQGHQGQQGHHGQLGGNGSANGGSANGSSGWQKPAAPTPRSRHRNLPQFVTKLYALCHDPALSDFIKWDDDGESFCVINVSKFAAEVLPLSFKHNNYASFQRQMHLYGFHRSSDSRGSRGSQGLTERFVHEQFKQGRKDLLPNVQRKPSSHKRQKVDPATTDDSSTTSSQTEELEQRVTLLEQNNSQLNDMVQQLQMQNQLLNVQLTRHGEVIQALFQFMAQQQQQQQQQQAPDQA